MNGIHDMGGMQGFGAVQVDAAEPLFHAPWERRVLAMVSLILGAGISSVDAFRYGIERMDPVAYLTAGYYGRWLASLETVLAENGMVRRNELEAWVRGERRVTPAVRSTPPSPGGPAALRHVATPPRFVSGQTVRARNLHPAGHTRLPRYVRGKRGVVARVHPAWVFPDTNAHGLGEHPQYAYAVRFEAEELWGPGADRHTACHVDLFESYLEEVAGE